LFQLDSGEPFGLPKGTVRGIIALGSLGLVAYSYLSTGVIDSALLAFAGPYLGFYFATRSSDPAVVIQQPAPEEPVASPALGDGSD
jgi:hypothetical protein